MKAVTKITTVYMYTLEVASSEFKSPVDGEVVTDSSVQNVIYLISEAAAVVVVVDINVAVEHTVVVQV